MSYNNIMHAQVEVTKRMAIASLKAVVKIYGIKCSLFNSIKDSGKPNIYQSRDDSSEFEEIPFEEKDKLVTPIYSESFESFEDIGDPFGDATSYLYDLKAIDKGVMVKVHEYMDNSEGDNLVVSNYVIAETPTQICNGAVFIHKLQPLG